MDNEQMILQAIAQLTDTVTKGFQDMEGRFEGIESRLDGQERKLRRTAVRQQLQDSQIEELSKIVQDMAENTPLRSWDGSAAICKEEAYQSFEEIGVGRRTAMRALEKAGAIRADKNSRRTKVIRLDGKCQRVIIVARWAVTHEAAKAPDPEAEDSGEQQGPPPRQLPLGDGDRDRPDCLRQINRHLGTGTERMNAGEKARNRHGLGIHRTGN